MNKNKLMVPLLGGIALVGGLGAGLTGMASAQTATPTTSTVVAATDTSAGTTSTGTATPAAAVTPAASTATTRPQGHRPMGQDGNITAINGTTITMQEEADEGSTVYTVDASNATVTSNGTAATLSSLAVGDKIFVDGTVSGSNVTATSVSLGHPQGGFGGHRDAPDTSSTTSTTTQ